jgi:hypothetical protein
MSKKELVEELIYVFDYAPELVYDDFIKRNDIEGKLLLKIIMKQLLVSKNLIKFKTF